MSRSIPIFPAADYSDKAEYGVAANGKIDLDGTQYPIRVYGYDVESLSPGDRLQGDVETRDLYRSALEKFEIFHVAVDDPGDCYRRYAGQIKSSFGPLLKKRLRVSTLDKLPRTILECLEECGTCRETDRTVTLDTGTETEKKSRGIFGLFSALDTASW